MVEDGQRCSKGGEELKKRFVMTVSAVLVVATLVAIWRFSAQNASESSALSGKLTEFVASWPWLDENVELGALEHVLRKLAHGSIYFVLGVGLTGMMATQRAKLIVWLVPVLGAILAMGDELHQSFVPGRSPGVRDVLIDTLGVSLGMLLILFCRRCYRRHRQRRLAAQKS